MKIYFLSQHQLTNGQLETLKKLGFSEVEQVNIIFGNNPVDDVKKVTEDKTIAIVCPLAVALELLRAGYTLIEFKNNPSARVKGLFLCEGAFVHTLKKSSFVSCPVPFKDQEVSSLNYNNERGC